MYKNKIKIYRLEQGMTLRTLAEKTGISAGYLCHLEKGTRKKQTNRKNNININNNINNSKLGNKQTRK